MERVEKVIASVTGFSRSQVKKMMRAGRVCINGRVAKEAGQAVDPESDVITVDSEVLEYSRHVYIMMNKPAGVISASADKNAATVVSLVPPELFRKGLFPAGRLDAGTVGFVLITDDGEFAHDILSPKNHVPKTYHVQLDAPADEHVMERFADGLVLKDGTRLAGAKLTQLDSGRFLYEIVITEGKYHQIKRMFGAFGLRVVMLKRVKIGGLELDETLGQGECRKISEEELKLITAGRFVEEG